MDPRRLKPGELCRVLNSTPLGEVIGERQLQRHRLRAGMRLASDGDAGRVDLLRYCAWLAAERHRPIGARKVMGATPAGPSKPTSYDEHRERMRRAMASSSRSGRDIGQLPPIIDQARRDACERNFRLFAESYFPMTFTLKWSPDHLKVIAKIETAVLDGGLFAMAMPRGSGKTSLCETAAVWAMLFGHREFVMIIGSDRDHAKQMLDSIKAEIEHNDLLHEDFPEVCEPVRRLEGIHQRAPGQLCGGAATNIHWTDQEIVLPTVQGSRGSGAIVRVAGITGRVRGAKYKRPDGRSVRPSLVLIDDPQTDESAKSPSQCTGRERIIAGAVLGLAGPGRKIAGLSTLTVVARDDLADRLLNSQRHPQWQGERLKMVYAFPTEEALWTQYAEHRAQGLRAGRGLLDATKFYRKNRKAMDAGSAVAWPQRFNPDELSALQHAMNLRLQDEAAFAAECQNEPLAPALEAAPEITAEEIAMKTNGRPRGEVPSTCTTLTAFIDVQGKALYWTAIGWEPVFTGYVVDYGTFPDQRQPYFTLREIRRTLAMQFPRAGLEGALYGGLQELTQMLFAREWQTDTGAVMRIGRCMIDANWGMSTDIVYQLCRQSAHSAMLTPSHGRWVGATSVPMAAYTRKPGDRVGSNWRMPAPTGRRAIRHILFDANAWKSHVMQRLSVPLGDSGCLSLFAERGDPHRMFAEQLAAERRVPVEARGRTVDEWKLRQPGLDNHYLDCAVGCAVAASMEGIALEGIGTPGPLKRQRIKFAEISARRQR